MTPQTAQQILDRHYLEIRCGLLDLAAQLDRVQRGGEASQIDGDSRLRLIAEGLKIVAGDEGNRAERLQLLFSDPYVDGWNQR